MALAVHLRKVLCDRDPSVMGAALCVIEKMVGGNAPHLKLFKDLVPSLVSILKQIIEHRLPADYDYHRIPAPWLQMKVIRILTALGTGDKPASEDMYAILSEVASKADTGTNTSNIGHAIVHTTIKAIATIYPNPTLLTLAATAVTRLIESPNHNLKYLGVTSLTSLVKSHPSAAAAHQMTVVDCLGDEDTTLQRKTLELLYVMASGRNVEFIAEKLLEFLEKAEDEFLRRDLTGR